MSHTYEFPRPALATDVALFGIDWRDDSLDVVLVTRNVKPYKGELALPGTFVKMKETIEEAAYRALREKTGTKPTYLEQLYTFSDIKRDPRERIVSVAHFALVRSQDFEVKASKESVSDAKWFNIASVLAEDPIKLAFDHNTILRMALERLRSKVRYAPVGFDLLPERFTIGELRRLYKIILGREPDISNFRRKVASLDFIVPVGTSPELTGGGKLRQKQLLRFDQQKYVAAVARGISFEV
jgi:8-oxo-dGTP diphosphatase